MLQWRSNASVDCGRRQESLRLLLHVPDGRGTSAAVPLPLGRPARLRQTAGVHLGCLGIAWPVESSCIPPPPRCHPLSHPRRPHNHGEARPPLPESRALVRAVTHAAPHVPPLPPAACRRWPPPTLAPPAPPLAPPQPWFYCDQCGDTIKKAKVAQHAHQCGSSYFTCIDCSAGFDLRTVQVRRGSGRGCRWRAATCQPGQLVTQLSTVCSATGQPTCCCWRRPPPQGHTQCVTEHEKYALGATKPGGYAAAGFAGDGAAKQQEGEQGMAAAEPHHVTLCARPGAAPGTTCAAPASLRLLHPMCSPAAHAPIRCRPGGGPGVFGHPPALEVQRVQRDVHQPGHTSGARGGRQAQAAGEAHMPRPVWEAVWGTDGDSTVHRS